MPSLSSMTTPQRLDVFTQTFLTIRREAGERILSRHHIGMRTVAPFAADMTVIEVESDDTWTLRLIGTEHCRRANRDRTQCNVLENCSPDDVATRLAIVEAMFDTPCGARTCWSEEFNNGMRSTTESVSFPSFGKQGERLIISCEYSTNDMTWLRRKGEAKLVSVCIEQSTFIDMDYGIPCETLRLSA